MVDQSKKALSKNCCMKKRKNLMKSKKFKKMDHKIQVNLVKINLISSMKKVSIVHKVQEGTLTGTNRILLKLTQMMSLIL